MYKLEAFIDQNNNFEPIVLPVAVNNIDSDNNFDSREIIPPSNYRKDRLSKQSELKNTIRDCTNKMNDVVKKLQNSTANKDKLYEEVLKVLKEHPETYNKVLKEAVMKIKAQQSQTSFEKTGGNEIK